MSSRQPLFLFIAAPAMLMTASWLGMAAMTVAQALHTGQPVSWASLLALPTTLDDALTIPVMATSLLIDRLCNGPERYRNFLNRTWYDMLFVIADTTSASTAFTILFTAGLSAWFAVHLNLLPRWHPVVQLSLWTQIPLAYSTGSFAGYWAHRLMHTRLLWPLHAIHHAASDLTPLSDSRGHPLENFFKGVPATLFLVTLGFSFEAIMLSNIVGRLQSGFAHSNILCPAWIERWLFIGPALHRVHHATAPEYFNCNYGLITFWDRLFGTFNMPDNARTLPTGVQDPRYDTGHPVRDIVTATQIWLRGLATEARLYRPAFGAAAIVLLTLACFTTPVIAAPAPHIAVVGETFVLTRPGHKPLTSRELIGATLEATFEGMPMTLRLDAVLSAKENAHIPLHSFSMKIAAGRWAPLCDKDFYGRRAAFPVAGAWQNGHFVADRKKWFVTCTSGSQGKCILFGYDPWKKGPHGEDLAPYYEACQHLVRADYEGNGVAHTKNGTMIDIWDRIGIEKHDPAPGFGFEAGWAPGGAVCVAHTRWHDVLSFAALKRAAPRLTARCDETRAATLGAILFTRTQLATAGLPSR